MSRHISSTGLLVLGLFLCQSYSLDVMAQGLADDLALRALYSFYSKRSVSDERTYCETMTLDYDGNRSVYYSDITYLRDSVSVIAFDAAGNICNEDAYAELNRYPSGRSADVSFIDYVNQTVELCYQVAFVTINGQGGLEMPRWSLMDEDSVTSAGFKVKKAKAQYLGRTWTVWYCPEVPATVGPWLLWGTPGLIAQATDSEGLFRFELLGVWKIDSTERYEFLNGYYHGHRRAGNYPIAEAEKIHNLAERDWSYMDQLAGMSSGQMKIKDRTGKIVDASRYIPYIPIIPDNYWK